MRKILPTTLLGVAGLTVIGLIGTIGGAVLGTLTIYLADKYRLVRVPIDVYQISHVPFRLDAKTLERGDSFTFTTDIGALDILHQEGGHPPCFWEDEFRVAPERFAAWAWVNANMSRVIFTVSSNFPGTDI